MVSLFNNLIFEPLLSLLVWIYNTLSFGDLGLAIIILTFFIRLILLPLFFKSSKDQTLVRKLQPEVDKIKQKHKKDKTEQGQALMELYKRHKVNPFSGFLLLIVQLPIFIALFRIFRDPDLIIQTFKNFTLLGMVNLTEVSITLVIIATAVQYFQGKISLGSVNKNQPQNKANPMAKISNSMIYIGPVLSFIILTRLPSALAVYWITSALCSVAQQIVINKKISTKPLENKIPTPSVVSNKEKSK